MAVCKVNKKYEIPDVPLWRHAHTVIGIHPADCQMSTVVEINCPG
jgi:hypothetical protein